MRRRHSSIVKYLPCWKISYISWFFVSMVIFVKYYWVKVTNYEKNLKKYVQALEIWIMLYMCALGQNFYHPTKKTSLIYRIAMKFWVYHLQRKPINKFHELLSKKSKKKFEINGANNKFGNRKVFLAAIFYYWTDKISVVIGWNMLNK